MSNMSDDLDESRRHGVPLDPRHPPLSTVSENRTPNNGWNPADSDYSLQHHQPSPLPYHVPQHLIKEQLELDRMHDSSSRTAEDLDGELSGLQAAAAKTALLIHGNPTKISLEGEVVTTEEEDDDQSSHWIFRKHVGFSNLNEIKSSHRQPSSHYRNGVSEYPYQQKSAKSSMTKSDLSPAKELSADSDDDTEKSNLLQQLHALRQQRQHLKQDIFPALCQNLNEWELRLSSSQQSHRIALSTLEAVSARRIWAQEEYQLACKCHVLGDGFFIWHRGPFGTINGFRLGKSAVTMVGLVKKCAGGGNRNGSQGTEQGGGGGGASLFSWGASENGTATSHASPTKNANNGTGNVTNPNAAPEKVILPWNEINSALGQVVFLLYTLQNTPYSGISFRKHILQPCGSATKIGVLKRQVLSGSAPTASSMQHPRNERRRITALAAYYHPGTPHADSKSLLSHPISLPAPLPGEVTWYNLHHYEENGSLLSMGYYARRNFNIALEGLLHCIAEACFVVEKRDMALAAPYIMRVDGLVVGKDVHGISEGIGGGAKEGEMATRSVPKRRPPPTAASPEAEEGATTKKQTKAELRRQSLNRAKDWAADRKSKKTAKDGVEEDDDVEKTKPDAVVEEEEEEEEARDVVKADIPPPPSMTRRSARRGGKSRAVDDAIAAADDDLDLASSNFASPKTPAADDASVGSRSTRRSTRRRTMTAKVAASAAPSSADKENAENMAENVAVEDASVGSRSTRRSARRGTANAASASKQESKGTADVPPSAVTTRRTRRTRKATKEPAKEDVPEVKAAEEPELKSEDEGRNAPAEEQVDTAEADPEVTKGVEAEEATQVDDVEEEEEEDVKAAVKEEEENKSIAANEDEVETAAKEEEEDEEIAAKEDTVEEVVNEPIADAEEETGIESKQEGESKVKASSETKEEHREETAEPLPSLLDYLPTFLHAVSVLWIINFAFLMTFGYDYWISSALKPVADLTAATSSSQRAICFVLGAWMLSTAGTSVAFGAESGIGWILTGSSLALASFAVKYAAETWDEAALSAPYLPIYSFSGYDVDVPYLPYVFSVSGFDVNVPDALVVLSLLGFASVLKRPTAKRAELST